MHRSKQGYEGGAIVRVDRKEGGAIARVDRRVCMSGIECVGVGVGQKRQGREAEKGMVLDASCDPL